MEEPMLVRYYHKNSEPMRSITALPEHEAELLAEKLSAQSDCRAYRRFGKGFAGYYRERIKAEQWLHEQFLILEGKPKLQNPLYFVLQPNALRDNFGDALEIRLFLREIDESEVSFTFGDSMANWFGGSPSKPFLKGELLAQIAACGGLESFLKKTEPFGYLEAQLWTDRFFK